MFNMAAKSLAHGSVAWASFDSIQGPKPISFIPAWVFFPGLGRWAGPGPSL